MRLDGSRLPDRELVIGVVNQFETLQHHAQRQGRLLQRELPPDTRSLPDAERQPGVGGSGLFGVRAEVIGVELLGVVAPDRWVAVQHRGQDNEFVLGYDCILAPQRRRLVRVA